MEADMSHQPAKDASDLEGAMSLAAATRRDALLRAARGEGFHLAEWAFGLVAILAIVTIFLNGNFLGTYQPAFWAVVASTAIAQALASRANRQIKALYALLEDVRPNDPTTV
jgi:tellurite resistance protein TehA-like permease